MKRLIVAVAAVWALAGTASAQTPWTDEAPRVQQSVTLTELALRDGSRLYGAIVTESETEVVFRTQGGTTMTVTRGEVYSLRPVAGVLTNGEFQPSDPNVTRLFFGPTGRSLKRGQVYLGVYEILLPFVQVGVTDRISVGRRHAARLLRGRRINRPFWITPKIQLFNGEKTQVSVGAFHGFSGEGGYGGIAYVVATRGTAAHSFTIGAGAGYSEDGGHPGVVMVGGEAQVRRNIKFITENYIWQGGHAILSGGVRFFGERLSADLALFAPVTEGFVLAPLVNFVYIF